MEKTLEFLDSIIRNKDDYIVLGCSGGPDSMCLLHLLYTYHFKIVVCCIDHNLRSESAEEYKFVKSYCEMRKIPFEGLKLENKSHENESYYRKKRYDFYKKIAKKYHTTFIATAHHGDDLVETVLMRLTRGTNLKGYIGFSKLFYEKEFTFLKPLIFYTKNDILEYNRLNQIPYFIDEQYKLYNNLVHGLDLIKEYTKYVHKSYNQCGYVYGKSVCHEK